MNKPALVVIFAVAAGLAGYVLNRPGDDGPRTAALTEGTGEAMFSANCAQCHGQDATGTEQGPPLVHIYYEPNHHADESFQRAVAMGVRAHHWRFGDMPPVEGLSRPDVARITAHVRDLQRKAGIFQ
jgi:mono/diheme cytochrome c family protein